MTVLTTNLYNNKLFNMFIYFVKLPNNGPEMKNIEQLKNMQKKIIVLKKSNI